MRLRTQKLPGWRGGRSCEQAGSLVMPKRRNQDMWGDHRLALCQSYRRIREIEIFHKDMNGKHIEGIATSAPATPKPSRTHSPETPDLLRLPKELGV